MPRACTGFDEALLSGFLDGLITVRERQTVRTHLLVCRKCRRLLSELGENRQACLATRFSAARGTGVQWRSRLFDLESSFR